MGIAIAWATIGFVCMIISFVVNIPATEEYRASLKDLESLKGRLNGSKVLAEFQVKKTKNLMWAHRALALYWIISFGVGMVAVAIPAVDEPQAQLRSLLISTGLIFGQTIIAVVQGILFYVTLTAREARKDWWKAAQHEVENVARRKALEARVVNMEEGLVLNQEDQDSHNHGAHERMDQMDERSDIGDQRMTDHEDQQDRV